MKKYIVLAAVLVAIVSLSAEIAPLGGRNAPALARQSAQRAGAAQVPVFEPDPLWSQALPNKWVTGQVGGVAVDSHDNVWVFHRPGTIPEGERGASPVSYTHLRAHETPE